ncbi:YbdK family carboxylate-amine ligase [Bdellovibrio sp. 22V]|uniref:carboxylate-amine ligase n=1 Tax=Bdellovibrio TaxID=958 RepID=UPI002543C3C3|nr:YbdK family carboxylate-amine ligase [Bdellovibrio sp. 22V]WII71614.1 YbdK family carboxylate-amine ligase [Bdellovibrio sp. 22V]
MELQIIHPETRDLSPISPDILQDWSLTSPHIKPELFQSMLEIDTPICKTAQEVEDALLSSSRELSRICRKHGRRLSSNGTHPFAKWHHRIFYPADRYQYLLERNQHIARRLMIYGLHVHIGMKSGEHCIKMMNEFLYYLPHMLAASASSPFWTGHDTGLSSSRITVFEAHPAGGSPCTLQSWEDFESIVEKLTRSQSITSFKDIWWDLRPSPNYGTLEIRICDGVPGVRRTTRLVAFIHLLALLIQKRLDTKGSRPTPPDWMVRENKWRASRFGVHAEILVDSDGNTKPLLQDIKDLVSEMKEDIQTLGYAKYIDEFVENDLAKPSYQIQRELFESTGSLPAVVDFLCDSFEDDLK